MEWIENGILIFMGLTMGGLVAAGVFAFITMLGVVTRFAAGTKTAKHTMLYEDMVVLGGTLGNIMCVFRLQVPFGVFILPIFGVFAGIFVGCLSMALAEAVNVLPVFSRRIRLKVGMPFIVLSFAVGKFLGAFYQMYINWK